LGKKGKIRKIKRRRTYQKRKRDQRSNEEKDEVNAC